MSLQPWWQVAVPHRDIREGKISDFAADLNSILKGEASIEYVDPKVFFQRTHVTKGLKNIIKDVFLSLSGKERSKIIQIQTPFGGGKTHALVALYHLAKHSEQALHSEDARKLLEEIGLNDIPKINLAIFVGTVPDPLKGKTPWGEIAEQLGLYELVEEHDKRRITPGREIIEKIIEERKPLLILIDELAEYTVKAREFEDQIFAFCQELTEAIKASKQCALVCTLPSSAPYGERGERVLSQLQRIFGRMQVIYTPVEGEELYQILRKRLFEELGEERIRKLVARKYFDLYQRLGEEVPHNVREPHYREKIEKAYPFHPELIDILFERWGSIPTFQRTRGVLRLLAEVVLDLYVRQHPSPLIQPAHINLGNPRIRRMFIEHIGEVFESVIASDIAGSAAKAARIDRAMGTEYSRFNIATGLATSIFFYSFSGGERRGVTTRRLRVAVLREEIPPPIIGDALRRLEDELWFLHHDEKNDLYYFSNVVSLNRVIVDKEEIINEEEIEREIRKRVERIAGRDFEVFIWPKSSSDVPDSRKLKLVILPPDLMAGTEKARKFIQEMIDRYSEGFRVYKNTLIFLLVDPNEYEGLKGMTRRFLALNAIKTDRGTMSRLTDEDKTRVVQRLKDADASLWTKVLSTYRYMVKASEDGFKEYNLGIPTLGEKPDLAKRVKEYLKDQEALLDKISPKVLLEKTLAREEERKSVAEVWEAFLKFPSLPMLENESVLKNAIVQGVKNGVFGLLIDEKIKYLEDISPIDITGDAIIVRKDIAQKIKEEELEEAKEVSRGPEEVGPEGPTPPISTRGPIRRYSVRAVIPWDKLSDVVRGVFRPLSREGAQISLEVKIDAKSEKGINRNTLENIVKETLKQIGASVLEEEEE